MMHPLPHAGCFVNRFNLAMSLRTMAFGMFLLLWILVMLFCAGLHGTVADAVHADDAAAGHRRAGSPTRSSAAS